MNLEMILIKIFKKLLIVFNYNSFKLNILIKYKNYCMNKNYNITILKHDISIIILILIKIKKMINLNNKYICF